MRRERRLKDADPYLDFQSRAPRPMITPRANPMKRLISFAEAAEILGISEGNLRDPRWRRRHRVPYTRVGRLLRFEPEQLEKWWMTRREQAVEEPRDPDLAVKS